MTSLITDLDLAHLVPWAPIAIAVLLVLAVFWRDRSRPWATDEPEHPAIDTDPPTAPVSLERYRRDADRG